jgi:TonB family protein
MRLALDRAGGHAGTNRGNTGSAVNMRPALRLVGFATWSALAACATAPQPPVIDPVRIEDASFLTRGPAFAPGLYVTVRICVTPQGQIGSAAVVLSSGDKRFDDYVLGFARRVQVQPQRVNGRPVAACDTVRVEINHDLPPAPGVGVSSAVG